MLNPHPARMALILSPSLPLRKLRYNRLSLFCVADDRLDGVSSFVPAPFAWLHALLALVGQVYSRIGHLKPKPGK
jgi:hypothetical protein